MCLTPVNVKAKYTENDMVRQQGKSLVPCGKCPECKQRRANAWIFRLLKEEKIHKTAMFLTLTYNNETVPITDKGFMTLKKSDVQKFLKRLRFNSGSTTIKYYFCGEYGTDTWRPHYHAIIFDADKEQIEKAWGLGHIYIGDVNGASIGYCTKYICKEARVPVHTNDDRLREFSLMSKNLGSAYMSDAMVKWHKENDASYVVVEGGYKQPLPRYYRDRIFTDEERQVMNESSQIERRNQFEKAVDNAGSYKEYYRNNYDLVKQKIQVNKDRQSANRKKI